MAQWSRCWRVLSGCSAQEVSYGSGGPGTAAWPSEIARFVEPVRDFPSGWLGSQELLEFVLAALGDPGGSDDGAVDWALPGAALLADAAVNSALVAASASGWAAADEVLVAALEAQQVATADVGVVDNAAERGA